MEIYANRDFGRMLCGTIRGRILEAGVEPQEFIVPPLGEYLNTLATLMRTYALRYYKNSPHQLLMTFLSDKDSDPGFSMSLKWDPTMQMGMRTFLAMVWTSLLVPETYHKALQVVSHTDEFFGEFHYRRLTEQEKDSLNQEIMGLMERPTPTGALGAAGNALLSAANRPLQGVSAGRSQADQRRRQVFLQSARDLCEAVETATDLPARRAYGLQLGGLLEAELQASRASRRPDRIERYWEEFELFFMGSRLAW